MDKSSLYARLTEIFREVFGDDEVALRPELAADQATGWDSLKHVRLMLTVEKSFGIKIATSEMVRTKNVSDLARLIEQKVQ